MLWDVFVPNWDWKSCVHLKWMLWINLRKRRKKWTYSDKSVEGIHRYFPFRVWFLARANLELITEIFAYFFFIFIMLVVVLKNKSHVFPMHRVYFLKKKVVKFNDNQQKETCKCVRSISMLTMYLFQFDLVEYVTVYLRLGINNTMIFLLWFCVPVCRGTLSLSLVFWCVSFLSGWIK